MGQTCDTFASVTSNEGRVLSSERLTGHTYTIRLLGPRRCQSQAADSSVQMDDPYDQNSEVDRQTIPGTKSSINSYRSITPDCDRRITSGSAKFGLVPVINFARVSGRDLRA